MIVIVYSNGKSFETSGMKKLVHAAGFPAPL
jgi:hypothetical protein